MSAGTVLDGKPRLRIAMIGTRGVPAAYGGFETAVEEIGSRMAALGHQVTVYCRGTRSGPAEYLGMRLVHRPALRLRTAETLSHTALSVAHAASRIHAADAAFVFNAANAPFLPALRARRIPVAVHVDGLEWKRAKWGGNGRRYYRWAEEFSVRWADALIADAPGIANYYASEFAVPTSVISYGAKIQRDSPSHLLASLGLQPRGFHLVVARFEPENHVDVIVEGYRRSNSALPLVVVGAAPYAAAYTDQVRRCAASDPRVRLVGSVFDADLLDQLYAHAVTYVHGHSVGGTNPSLLRAMGAGTAVIAWDVEFNRDVAGSAASYFSDAAQVGRLIDSAEQHSARNVSVGDAMRRRAEAHYNWEDVTRSYLSLAERVVAGYSTHGIGHPRLDTQRTSGTAPSSYDGLTLASPLARR